MLLNLKGLITNAKKDRTILQVYATVYLLQIVSKAAWRPLSSWQPCRGSRRNPHSVTYSRWMSSASFWTVDGMRRFPWTSLILWKGIALYYVSLLVWALVIQTTDEWWLIICNVMMKELWLYSMLGVAKLMPGTIGTKCDALFCFLRPSMKSRNWIQRGQLLYLIFYISIAQDSFSTGVWHVCQ